MPLIVPVRSVPSQVFAVSLGGQSCQIALYQKDTGLYADLFVGTSPIIQGVLCRNNVKIVQSLYLGFIGDLAFVDTQPSPILGPIDPIYTGLGTRFIFVYFSPSDLNGGG